MNGHLLVFAVLLPLAFWFAYHYYHDRHRPEPVVNLLIALALGAAASCIAGLGYTSLGLMGLRPDVVALAATNLPGLFAVAVLSIGLVEEVAKMLPFLLVLVRLPDFDEPLDGVLYASFLAMGFALVENVYYLETLTLNQAVARGFAGPVVHMVFASLWGYRIGLARLTGGSVAGAALIWLPLSALLHGLYDFIVLAGGDWALVAASLLIAGLWIWRLALVVRLGRAGHQRPG